MADIEIDSFVRKFKLLRGAGIEASLTFETKLGEVCITLNCKVGRNVLPPVPKSPIVAPGKRYRSPSYYRRQARRKAEREVLGESFEARSVADEANIAGKAETEKMDEKAVEAKEENVSDVDVIDEMDSNDSVIHSEAEEVLEEDLREQLNSIIRQSQENRDIWDKFHTLPP